MSDAFTAAGTILYVTAGVPATDDEAGYESLSWTEVGEVSDIPGGIGKLYNLVTFNPLATRRTEKRKGSFNDGSTQVTYAYDSADAGQIIMDTAADSDAVYRFRIELQTDDNLYFGAMVMGKPITIGTVDNIVTKQAQLEITTNVIEGGAFTTP